MATTKRLIDSALRSIGVLASGEEARPAELQDALLYAKQMMDGWANETLLVPALVHETFTLTSARQYTIGPAGDFDTVRPTLIEHARIRDAGGLERPVEIVSLNIWAEIGIKDTIHDWPSYLYYEPSYPLGVIRFSANTRAGSELKLVTSKPLAELPALTSETEFPPGYERCIRLGLALELAPEYGKQVDPVIAAQYRQARAVLKRTNSATRTGTLKVDGGLLQPRGYDIYSGP